MGLPGSAIRLKIWSWLASGQDQDDSRPDKCHIWQGLVTNQIKIKFKWGTDSELRSDYDHTHIR